VGVSTSFDPLPADLQEFLRSVIESYDHLAVLLWLRRERSRDWAEIEVVDALAIPGPLAHTVLADLSAGKLLQSVRGESGLRYRYAASGATDALVERLETEYSHSPARLMRLLSAYAIERVRTGAIRAFADSFVIRKKDSDRG
jgi:hypothetical protein